MKQLFVISFVLWLSIDSLLAQKEQNPGPPIYFRNNFDPGQQPLVVIDDSVYYSLRLATGSAVATNAYGVTGINPDGIDSITILKNDSAVYLYGDKAKYGAIIISTKHAKDKTSKIQKE